MSSVISRPQVQGWILQTRASLEDRSMATAIISTAKALLKARSKDDGSVELHHV